MKKPFAELDAFVCIDVETTGFNPEKDRILEIGAVVVKNRKMPVDSKGELLKDSHYHVYIDPEQDVPAGAVNVHGIDWATAVEASNGRNFKAVMHEFADFLAQHPYPLVAHNADFDMSMLQAELKRNGGTPITMDVYDSLQEARVRYPRARRHSLDALIRKFQLTERDMHGALSDAQLLGEVCLAMTRRTEDLINAPSQESPRRRRLEAGEPQEQIPPKLADAIPIIRPTTAEKARHQKAMKKPSQSPTG